MNETLFELQNVSKVFGKGNGRAVALDKLSLGISSGELIALRGPSGSGKSTLLNILGLIEAHDEGRVLFRGEDLREKSTREIDCLRRFDVGFIFQNFNLSNIFSAVENVEYPLLLLGKDSKRVINEKAVEALRSVGMGDHLLRRPAQLSGGQRQRVAIARSIVKNPRLILADEPTANLDQKSAGQVIELLCELNRVHKTTTIIATHDENIANKTNRVVYLQDGKILWDKSN